MFEQKLRSFHVPFTGHPMIMAGHLKLVCHQGEDQGLRMKAKSKAIRDSKKVII